MMKNKITEVCHIVPYINDFGGIQEFAKQQYSYESANLIQTTYNWKRDINIIVAIILRSIPSKFGSGIAEKINMLFTLRHLPKDGNGHRFIYHHWLVDSSFGVKPATNIITCHGLEILKKHNKGYRNYAVKKSLGYAKAIHANSMFTRNYIIASYGVDPKKIHVINPGINLEKYKYKYKKNAQGVTVVGTLTRLVSRKNIHAIIEALSYLKNEKGIDFIYYLAGDGPLRKDILETLDASNISYRYWGKITEEEKINVFYPSLDLFVLTPLESNEDVEGFGIVYLEANAIGIPVVAARTGGISDAVSEGFSGVFADPGDYLDIAKKIESNLSVSENSSLKARRWAEKFSTNVMHDKFEKLYRSLR